MRKALCKDTIIQKDGSLNLKYFNVKKGHYWCPKENKKLITALMKYAPKDFKKIRKEFFDHWTDTEIKLRICKVLRIYTIEDYQHPFTSEDEILKEAKSNKQKAIQLDKSKTSKRKHLVGGVFFNPPEKADSEFK